MAGLKDLKSKFGELKVVDFFKNDNASGFTEKLDEGSKTLYKQGSGDLDDNIPVGNSGMVYTKENPYEQSILKNKNKGGLLPTVYKNLIETSTNKLHSRHWSELEFFGTHIPQEVDFFDGKNSYFEPIRSIPGFTQYPVLKETLYGNTTSNLSGGVGLIFNSSQKYSTSEIRYVDTPIGYADDNNLGGADILVRGNLAQDGNPIVKGKGYPNILENYNSWSISIGIDSVPYNPSGMTIQEPKININPTNSSLSNDDYLSSDRYDFEHKFFKLGYGDYSFEALFNNDQTVKISRSSPHPSGNSNLNLNPGGFQLFNQSGFRGDEPYHISRTGGELGFLSKTDYSSRLLPLGRSVADLERLGKFALSPAGILWIAKENILARFSGIIH